MSEHDVATRIALAAFDKCLGLLDVIESQKTPDAGKLKQLRAGMTLLRYCASLGIDRGYIEDDNRVGGGHLDPALGPKRKQEPNLADIMRAVLTKFPEEES